MEKLNTEKGSTLVAVVVFAIVLAIGAAGYMHVMSNTVSHEVDALNDEMAYQTAESGLSIGIAWLREPANWQNREDKEIYRDESGLLNNCSLLVKCSVNTDKSTTWIFSRVNHPDLAYTKELKYVYNLEPQTPGTLIDSFPIGSKAEVLTKIRFDGHVHSNVPIKLPGAEGEAGVTFYGNVTVHNEPGEGGNYSGGTYDYTSGVWKKALSSDKGEVLDATFTAGFEPLQPPLFMPEIPSDDAIGEEYRLDHFINKKFPSISIPTYTDEKQNFLRFSNSTVWFHTYDNFGNPISAELEYFDASGENLTGVSLDIDNKYITTDRKIGVLGTVKGNTTVITTKDIVILGDLIYDHFDTDLINNNPEYYENYDNTGNYGIGTIKDDINNNSYITLVAEQDIIFDDPTNPNKVKEKYYDPTNTTTVLPDCTASQTNLFLTASLIAKEDQYGIQFRENNGVVVQSDYKYTLYNIGSRIINTWSSYFNSDPPFFFYTDTRINEEGLRGPGIPYMTTQPKADDDGKYLLPGPWSENNIVPKLNFPIN